MGNLPFQRLCKTYGVGITCSEMAMSVPLLKGQQSEWAILQRHESEDMFGVQVIVALMWAVHNSYDLLQLITTKLFSSRNLHVDDHLWMGVYYGCNTMP